MSHQLLRRRQAQPSPPSPQAEPVVLAAPDLQAATGAVTAVSSPAKDAAAQATTTAATTGCKTEDNAYDQRPASHGINCITAAAAGQACKAVAECGDNENNNAPAPTTAADVKGDSSISFTAVNDDDGASNDCNTTNKTVACVAEDEEGNAKADDSAISGTSQVARCAVLPVAAAAATPAASAAVDGVHACRCGSKRPAHRASASVTSRDGATASRTSNSRAASHSMPHSRERHASGAAKAAMNERTNDGSLATHAMANKADEADDEDRDVAAKLRAVASATAALLREERRSSRDASRASQVRRRLLSPSPPSTPASWVDTAHSSAMRASDSVRPRPAIRLLRPPSPSPPQSHYGGVEGTDKPRSASHEASARQISEVTAVLQVGGREHEDSAASATLFSTIYGLSTPLPPLRARALASDGHASADLARRGGQGSCVEADTLLLRTCTGLRGQNNNKSDGRNGGGDCAAMLAATTTVASPSPAPPRSESSGDKGAAYGTGSGSSNGDDESSPNLNRLGSASEAAPTTSTPDAAQARFEHEVEAMSRLSAALSATRAANTELEKKLKTAEVLRRADATRLRQREQECAELRRRCAGAEAALEELRRSEAGYAQRVQSLTAALESANRLRRSASRGSHEDKAQQTEVMGDATDSDDAHGGGVVQRRALAAELAQLKVAAAEQAAVLDRLGLRAPYPEELVGAAVRRLRRLHRRVASRGTAPSGATLSAALLSSKSRTSDAVTTMSVDEQSHSESVIAVVGQSGLRQALGSIGERLNRPVAAKKMLVAASEVVSMPPAILSQQQQIECKENV